MTRRTALSTAALLSVMLFAACSDGDGLTANQKQDISNFRAGADAVCARLNQAGLDTRALYDAQFGGRTPTVEEAHDFLVRQVLPLLDRQVGDLHDLGEPTLDRNSWDDIMRQLDRRLSAFKYAADNDPLKTLLDFYRPAPAKDTLQQQFVAFGAPECAKNA
jgi:hypothetical protein